MIDGITLLNQFTFAPGNEDGIGLIVFGIILALSFLVVSIICFLTDEPAAGAVTTVICVIGCCLLAAGIKTYNTPVETHYQVLIEDSVPMNEFLDKYEIVKQEGLIYTIKEKTE